ncbi:MAG: right-handed parallel beta-helix repeat-containing protein, partial [Planctomycetota bacterium]
MKKASLISVALLLVLTGQAQSHWPPTDPATILPQNPTRSDVVTITLSGVWCSICIPNASAVSVVGNSVYFDVITRYPEDLVCILIPAAWQLTQFVGPLPPGKYTVYTRWLVEYTSVPWSVQNDTYIPIAEFTVTGQYYYVAVDGNDSNNGLTPETAFATIQKGINTAVNGDTVIVLPGTYTGPGNRDIDFLGKAITVRSADPNDPNVVATTVIDCQHLDGHRGFHFHSGEDANSLLSGLTIKRGRVRGAIAKGGGMYFSSSSPKIENCQIVANYAFGTKILETFDAYGGGVYCTSDSHPTFIKCIIKNNRIVGGDGWGTFLGFDAYGGGVYSDSDCNVTFSD